MLLNAAINGRSSTPRAKYNPAKKNAGPEEHRINSVDDFIPKLSVEGGQGMDLTSACASDATWLRRPQSPAAYKSS
jgi:hypothetical protein